MPRYFFNMRTQDGLETDPEGADLESPELAKVEAVQAARELMAVKVMRGEIVDGDQFEITDEDGEIITIVPLRSVVRFD